MILFTKTQFYNIQKKIEIFFFSFEMYFTMASTITKQLEQNELIEQIVFMMSTKFKIDNKEASEYVFKKLYENTAIPGPTNAVKVSKETSKKSKKVADHVPVEAITAVVVKDAVVVKEVVKAPAKRSKKVAAVEAEVVVVKDADVTEVVVKAPAKRSKKVATVQEDTAKESSGDDAAKEVGVVKAPAKRSKKVAAVEAEVVVVKDADEMEEMPKAVEPAQRTKKEIQEAVDNQPGTINLEIDLILDELKNKGTYNEWKSKHLKNRPQSKQLIDFVENSIGVMPENEIDANSFKNSLKTEVVVKAPAKKSKKVATVQEDTSKESSGDETTKESKPSKRGKKVETLKTAELLKVTEELQEDIIDG